jgi:protocatechuate 3,4-dioxygenase beta subunit
MQASRAKRRRRSAALVTSLLTLAFVFLNGTAAFGQPPTITLDPATDTNAVGTNHTVTATVMDGTTPIVGAAVHFAVSAEGNPTPTSGDDSTDADGEATFTFSNAMAVTNTITACIEIVINQACGPGEETDTGTKTWEQRVADAINLTPATDVNAVGTTHTVTAEVLDQFGEPLGGIDIRFEVAGPPVPSPTGGNAVTNASGEAQFAFSASATGTNTITACVDDDPANDVCNMAEPTDTATKEWQERVETAIEVTPGEAINHPGDDHTVTATVVDQFGNPVAGVTVEINVTGGGTPTPSSQTAITDSSGEVEFTFTNPVEAVNTVEACFTVDATEICDTATKSWEEPEPETITLEPATDTNAVGTNHSLTATVLDQFEDPFPGGDVHFDVSPEGDPTPPEGDNTTDAAGEAEFTFSNDQEVTNNITACIDEDSNMDCDVGEPSDTATKAWEEPEAEAIFLEPATDTNVVGTPHAVTATVTDQFGQPFQGAVVLFDVSAQGTPAPTSGADISDASGEAGFTFTNSSAGVTNTITACLDIAPQNGVCDLGEPTDTATKSWTSPPVDGPFCPGFEGDPRNQVVGTSGDDVLTGTAGPDIICGLGGDDTMSGLGGGDLILGGPGNDIAIGGDGNDVLRGHAGNDVLRGGRGADRLNGGGGRNILRGGPGNDRLVGGDGNDLLVGGAGKDRLRGGPGRDTLRGGRGNDRLNGGPGVDRCRGGPGNDVVVNCEN